MVRRSRAGHWLDNDFKRWCIRNGHKCNVSSGYVAFALEHVVGTRFQPGAPAFFVEPQTQLAYANTYRAFEPTTDSADAPEEFLELLERLAPDERQREVFTQYLAHGVQHPEQRPSFHIMIPSDTGTGKGFLFQAILSPLLIHTAVVNSFDRLTGQFSTLVEDKLLVLLDDCKAKTEATQTKLKSILTEEFQFVERKNLQGGMVPSHTRFILASNERRPLHLDDSERRWFVLSYVEHKESRAETQAFIGRLARKLEEPDALSRIYNYLRTYSLDGFNHKALPMGGDLQAVIELSRDPYAEFVEEYGEAKEVFTFKDLGSAFQSEGMSRPADKYLRHLIEEAGFVKARPVIDGKQVTLYHPAGMSLDKIRAAYTPPDPY